MLHFIETKPESIGGTPSKENISEDNKEIFGQLIQTAKQYTDEGKIKDALELYREALKINPDHDKLAKKITKIEVIYVTSNSYYSNLG